MRGFGIIAAVMTLGLAADDTAPVVLKQDRSIGICRRQDGTFAYYVCEAPQDTPSLPVFGGGTFTLTPRLDVGETALAPLPTRLVESDNGELHAVLMKRRGDGPRPAVSRFIDLWHRQTVDGRTAWAPESCIWRGYTGAVMMRTRLRGGRLLVPFGKWIPNRPVAPPTGCHISTVLYSDDDGASWHLSDATLTSPCVPDYNGNNYGACEPVVVELSSADQLYMLMRTQAGFLYESHSTDGGTTWSDAVPSRFHASTGPPGIVRLSDGRIVAVWNNCNMPPRIDGQGVYGGRDALHAAISTDDGRTWRGFREIYRDPARNETPPKRGDRGTAYPYVSFDAHGWIVVESGQGKGRRNFLRFHPDFLTETEASDDFSSGLSAWHVFKPFGPARGYWRDRTVGARLRPHPDHPDRNALWLRHADAHAPDGATWNFPLGWAGKMHIRIRLEASTQGASIALGDRMFEPTDRNGDELAMFELTVTTDTQTSSTPSPDTVSLPTQTWHDLRLAWNLDDNVCSVSVNGHTGPQLPLRHRTLNGLSYLRLRAAASRKDATGVLVEHVHVTVTAPQTPAAPLATRQAMQETFFELMSTRRNRVTAAPASATPDRPADPTLPAPQG